MLGLVPKSFKFVPEMAKAGFLSGDRVSRYDPTHHYSTHLHHGFWSQFGKRTTACLF
jgi:hypothetical protein